MILKKPYAFLIKHFKLIHLLICILMIYLISISNNCLHFFNDYMNNDIFEINKLEYVNIFAYLSLILMMGLVSTIVILMRKKNKPLLIYIFTIVMSLFLFVGFIYIGSVIDSLQYTILDRKSISLCRDIIRFMLIGQFIFLIPYIIRTLGFDIKKFDFKKDLQELDIDVSDNEEFELISPIDSKKIKKYGRRRLRELKYYYIENKIFILIIISIISLFLGIKVISFVVNNVNFNYREKSVINLDRNYTLSIDDSYIITKDDKGVNISVRNNAFVVVKFTVKSLYPEDFTLDINKFVLKVNNNFYVPDRSYYDYFKSYGIGYKNQKFSLDDSKTFILVYVIPNKYKKRSMKLEYNYGYTYKGNEPKMIKKIVKLKPEIIN